MKITWLILTLLAACFRLQAQSKTIKDVLRKLPAKEIYSLTKATRDSLLQGKTYYPADNDSNEIIAYNYGASAQVNDYIYVSLSFETGQRASGMIELRSFLKKNGDRLIVVSQTGGVPAVNYQQTKLSAFIYTSKGHLPPNPKKILPEADVSLLIKPGAPESVKKTIYNNANLCYDFSKEKITLALNSYYLTSNAATRKWLKGDCIYFTWTNDRFVRSSIEFVESE